MRLIALGLKISIGVAFMRPDFGGTSVTPNDTPCQIASVEEFIPRI